MKETMPPTDMFWGDRISAMTDPFGHNWNFATFKRRVDPAEMERAMKEQFGGAMGGQSKTKKKPGTKT
jgi:PhnB protein